jgi:glycosyltransferase involved in cell wall biosynthesis
MLGNGGAEGGSWLVAMAASLSQVDGVQLSITFPWKGTAPATLKGEAIHYYPVEPSRALESFRALISVVKPDLVHIFGTEYSAAREAMVACRSCGVGVIVSVQGLLSFIGEHYFAGIPPRVQLGASIRDILRRDSLGQQRRKLAERSQGEIEVLRQADYVIGRTTWDRVCVMQVDPLANYRTCNESLRPSFYSSRWSISTKQEHLIFVSQGYYPIKGLHWLLRAMPTVVERFPNARLAVAGPNPLRGPRWIQRLRRSSYDHYLVRLMRELKLEDKVLFLGSLSETEMRDAYLRSHVYILPSSIENSSNSLGEAMILGVPSVASYVGGTPDFIQHDKDGLLYQADAHYMLADAISRVFSNDDLARTLSEHARTRALVVYDNNRNCRRLLSIYHELVGTRG